MLTKGRHTTSSYWVWEIITGVCELIEEITGRIVDRCYGCSPSIYSHSTQGCIADINKQYLKQIHKFNIECIIS